MSIATRIKDCIDNHEKYVAIMAAMPDKELAKKLDLVHIQSQIAEQTKNTGSLQLLEVWRTQIIEARILKAENNIPDAPNEIELAIRDIETVVATAEDREEIVVFSLLAGEGRVRSCYDLKESHAKVQQQQDNDSQLSLF